jgi:sRNA-binding carbon storage regulator CsrA
MGLAMECNGRMRIRIGDNIYVYTDRNVQLLIEAPKSVAIRREYCLSKEGTFDDRRDAKYSDKIQKAPDGEGA